MTQQTNSTSNKQDPVTHLRKHFQAASSTVTDPWGEWSSFIRKCGTAFKMPRYGLEVMLGYGMDKKKLPSLKSIHHGDA